jgi:hypothetical protein
MRLRGSFVVAIMTALMLAMTLPSMAALQLSSPVLLTSAGQSPDVVMAKVLLGKTGVTVNMKQTAKDADLAGIKTLVIVIGASSKGLGAAGLDANSELLRVKKLVQAARSAGVKVVAMHIGGNARRGSDSNKLIEAVVPQADAVVVVADGNRDQIFNKQLRDNAEFYSVAKIADASGPLNELFGK